MSAPEVMKKLGKFEILDKVGQGAMGVVYKARDPLIGRTVALKTLTTGLSEDPNLLKRFYSEARAAGGLQHPNIVTIYELGHEGSTPFIVMQFLNGESLDRLISRRPTVPLSQKIGFVVCVCRALDYAHKQVPPVIHRDIKPGNVMVTAEGAVMVVDFGIARLGEGTRSQSAGMLIGTLAYMAPQLFRGGTADARSDIWATGVMLYELLAYERPFDGSTAAALMSNIMIQEPRAITKLAPETPPDLEAILHRMLCKETDGRYQSMEEVLMELEPAWRQLQQTDVAKLVANSRQLFAAGSLGSAQEELRRALQIDTSNTQAKSLLEKVNAEIRRSQILPQLKVRIEKVRGYLAAGQPEEALAEAEAIMRVDSTFQPAREAFEQAQAAVERAHMITEALRALRQRLAEGALADAEIQLVKVLEMDPGNVAALDLSKQIRAENARRELRKRRDETLHRARTLWTNLEYDDCIALLLSARERFPGDLEIIKLLETAQQDQAEQHRQTLLAEVRNLISAQRFDDALTVLGDLFDRYPADPAATNLQKHALQGKEQQGKDRRLSEEKSKLQTWLRAGKYKDVIAQGEKLSREFSDDFEFNELLDFARTEQFRTEKNRRLEQWLEQIRQAIKDSRFPEAIQNAQKALDEFSQNVDVLILLERAKKQQSEKEKHELLKQRLREVEKKIERQDLTDAIHLARQTLVTVGPHPGISDILHKAEREYEFREIKRREQEATVEQARTLVDENDLVAATILLKGALGTQLFNQADPRVISLLREIDARQHTDLPSGPSGSLETSEPPNDYIYQHRTTTPDALSLSEQDLAAATFSATVATGPQSRPSASSGVQPASPVMTERKPRAVSVSQERTVRSEVWQREANLESRTWKFALAAGVFLVGVLSILVAVHFLSRPGSEPPAATQSEIALQRESQQLRSQGKFDEASSKDREIVSLGSGLSDWAKRDLENMQAVQQQEAGLLADAKSAEQQRDYHLAQQKYLEVVDLDGPRQSSARVALESVEALMKGEAAETIAQRDFDRGVQSFNQRDYGAAEKILRECLSRAPENWPQRSQVEAYLTRIASRISQLDVLQRAQKEFTAMQYESARADATQSAGISNGDSQTRASALELLRRIQGRDEQRKAYEQATMLQSRGQLQQAKNLYDQVSSFAEGDSALAEKAKSDALRLSDIISSKNASMIKNVEDIDEAIKQGQFDLAEAKLKEVPSDQNDFGRLKSAIVDGRREDSIFQTKEVELAKAEGASDEAALRAVRDFFVATSSRSGRHSHQAAENVFRIDLDLKKITAANQPPVRPSPVKNVVTEDQAKINQLREDYKNGFQNKNVLLLRHIWPSITDKKVKEYEDTFKIAESLQWNLNTCDPPSVSGNTATLRCIQDIEIRPRGGELQHQTDAVTFYLEKQGSDWTIARVDAQKLKH